MSFIAFYDAVLLCSYSKGLGGLVGRVLGNDHILNIPNSYFGLIFFPILTILGESPRVAPSTCSTPWCPINLGNGTTPSAALGVLHR